MYISISSLILMYCMYQLIQVAFDILFGGTPRAELDKIHATNAALLAKYGPAVFKQK